ncbi:uncharacterized protein HD556DRAFT_400242 [Suillus plorans]|uniref:Reverse transcriptase zinc-binding domain-containing protein n=1 Tax=Suillus plorans TaxID=116603 RepID=A0A9P7AT65_9AGAM|nr:uncharacterized protein HD556DRAFT_400242 [Suillus plorans]KAG1795200.1 hypothetical protein HD556DRAFT_400242 [Suillus plorans]
MLWLRTRHISLNQHLHRIGKSASPNCPHCEDTPETVQRFLLRCPQYAREGHTLTSVLRRRASSIKYLLTDVKATAHLIRFVNSTGRLKPTTSNAHSSAAPSRFSILTRQRKERARLQSPSGDKTKRDVRDGQGQRTFDVEIHGEEGSTSSPSCWTQPATHFLSAIHLTPSCKDRFGDPSTCIIPNTR